MRFGRFEIRPEHPEFRTAGEIRGGHHLVFPGAAVGIRQEGRDPFVADPNLVVLYNRKQEYERIRVSDRGDRCYWLSCEDELLLEASDDFRLPARRERPFPLANLPGGDWSYLIHRVLARHLEGPETSDPLNVEEVLLGVLGEVVRRLVGADSEIGSDAGRELAERVKGILNLNIARSLTLAEIGKEIGVSPYHLCRSFRSTTGATIHRYLTRLRLRLALTRIVEDEETLSEIAFDLGFSSHSHFSATFRRVFDMTPSEFRDRASVALLDELSSRVQG